MLQILKKEGKGEEEEEEFMGWREKEEGKVG